MPQVNRIIAAGLLALLLSPIALALEAKPVKTASDKAGNWLVDQYDAKEKVFNGEDGKDPVTVAMIVHALCTSPRDYKETNGPYISEPVKFLLTQTGGLMKPAASSWIRAALESTKNEKYAETIKTLAELQLPSPEKLEPVTAEKAALLNAWGHLSVKREKDAQKAAAAGIAEALMKLQRKNGSFGDNLQVNALALRVLTQCYASMK